MATRERRGKRRRPDLVPPKVERIPPRSGLSRAEVIANQRLRIFEGLAVALVHHGYEDTKITDIVELSGVSRATFYERFESKEACFAAAYEDGVERLAAAVGAAAGGGRGWGRGLSVGLAPGPDFLAVGPALAHPPPVQALAAPRPPRPGDEAPLGPPPPRISGDDDRPRDRGGGRLALGLLWSVRGQGRVLFGDL